MTTLPAEGQPIPGRNASQPFDADHLSVAS